MPVVGDVLNMNFKIINIQEVYCPIDFSDLITCKDLSIRKKTKQTEKSGEGFEFSLSRNTGLYD